jgi:hypothetical protein
VSTSARLLLEQAACSTDDRLNWNVNWVRSEIEVCEKVCFFFPPDNISFLFSTFYDCSGARGEAVSTLRCMKLVDDSELEPYQFFLESGIWF